MTMILGIETRIILFDSRQDELSDDNLILDELNRSISRGSNWQEGVNEDNIKILETHKGKFRNFVGGEDGSVWRRKYFQTDRRIGIFRTRGKQSCMIRHSHRGFRSKSLRSAGS